MVKRVIQLYENFSLGLYTPRKILKSDTNMLNQFVNIFS